MNLLARARRLYLDPLNAAAEEVVAIITEHVEAAAKVGRTEARFVLIRPSRETATEIAVVWLRRQNPGLQIDYTIEPHIYPKTWRFKISGWAPSTEELLREGTPAVSVSRDQ